MMIFDKIIILTLCGLVINFKEANSSILESPKRPHIIFIMADDLGWNDVGFHGDDEFSTPNLDALAYSGVILNNYYVQPLCTPSRGTLLSGMYPIHTGLQWHVITPCQPYGLPLNFTLIPEYLKPLGYTTRIVGKWHIGYFRKEYTPTYRGFDSHFGYWEGMIDYYNHGNEYNSTVWGYDIRRNMDSDRNGVGTYATDLFADESVNIINEHNTSEPLFLYFSHLATHVASTTGNEDPLQAPPEVIEKFSYIEDESRRKFAAMVWKIDESVGRVVEALEQNGMLNDSIIIFSADNGGAPSPYENSAASNWPLRGTKNSMWEGGIRASSFIWSPLINNLGRVSTELMHISDWLPTLYAAAGGDASVLDSIDGINVWESIQSDSPSPREEFLVNIDPVIHGASIRNHEWKLVFNPTELEYQGWYGPSGRNSSLNSNSKEKENRFMNIQSSPAGRAVQNLMPNVFENIKALAENAEVLCGEVPENATVSCNDISNPCLFNMLSDPCEYYDVSKLHPSIVETLLNKIQVYNSTAVPIINQPADPRGNPEFWNDTWVNWFDYLDESSQSFFLP